MRRFNMLLALIGVVLLGTLVLSAPPVVVAQEATPGAEEFMPEGITFEPLAFGAGLALPSTGELFMARVSFEPGTGFPIEEGDPAYALAVIESGELTVRQDSPLVVTRAEAIEAAMTEGEEGSAPETEEIAAGQEVTVGAGDTVLFPPNAAGEIRNDSQERTVVLVAIVEPPAVEGTPAAGTPTTAVEDAVEVSLTEFAIEMPTELPAGPTTFEITNVGTGEHNFEVEGQGIEEELPQNLAPGTSGTLTVDLAPGTYEVYCPVGNHEDMGMRLELTVTE